MAGMRAVHKKNGTTFKYSGDLKETIEKAEKELKEKEGTTQWLFLKWQYDNARKAFEKYNRRDEVMTHISDFNALLQKGVVLTLDGYRRKFKGFMTANAPEKTISKERYKSSFKFTGYWFSDDVTISWQEKNEIIFETKGNRWTPCRLTITALEYIETMKINGLSDEITIKTIPRGATVVIDGETGFVTMDGENKFKDVEMFEFPYLKTGKDKEHHIIFSDKNAIVTIQYKPMWL